MPIPTQFLSGAFAAAVFSVLFRSFLTITEHSVYNIPVFFAVILLEVLAGYLLHSRIKGGISRRETICRALPLMSLYLFPAVFLTLLTRGALGIRHFDPLPWHALTAYPAAVFLPFALPAGFILGEKAGEKISCAHLSGLTLWLIADSVFLWWLPLMRAALLPAGAGLLVSSAYTKRKLAGAGFILGGILAVTAAAYGLTLPVENFIRNFSRQGFIHTAGEVTPYGEYSIYRDNSQRVFALNHTSLFAPDEINRVQEVIHIPLLQHIMARNVLIIGEWPEAVQEALRYPAIESVHWASPVPEAARDIPEPPPDPRIRVVRHRDPRTFIRRLGYGAAFDAVIISLSDPMNIFLNRYYTFEFFRELKSALAPHSLIAVTLDFADEGAGRNRKLLNHSVINTARKVFPNTLLLPTGTPMFLASHQRNFTTSWAALAEFARVFEEKPSYITPSLIRYKMSTASRWEDEISLGRLNLDSRPAPLKFSFNELLFSFGFVSGAVIDFTERLNPLSVNLVFLALAFLAGAVARNRSPERKIRFFGAVGTFILTVFLYSMMILVYIYNGQLFRYFSAVSGAAAGGTLLWAAVSGRTRPRSSGQRARALFLPGALFMVTAAAAVEVFPGPPHPAAIIALSFFGGFLFGGCLFELGRALSRERGGDSAFPEPVYIFTGLLAAAAGALLLLPVTGVTDIIPVLAILCLPGIFALSV